MLALLVVRLLLVAQEAEGQSWEVEDELLKPPVSFVEVQALLQLEADPLLLELSSYHLQLTVLPVLQPQLLVNVPMQRRRRLLPLHWPLRLHLVLPSPLRLQAGPSALLPPARPLQQLPHGSHEMLQQRLPSAAPVAGALLQVWERLRLLMALLRKWPAAVYLPQLAA